MGRQLQQVVVTDFVGVIDQTLNFEAPTAKIQLRNGEMIADEEQLVRCDPAVEREERKL